MGNQERDIVNAIGALAEMSSLFFNALIDNGISEDAAIALTSAYIRATLNQGNKNE